ncbi:vesicle transport protein USE1-like [Clytia hemisphaerica]|uniref:Vesicle transport protein USE1 n=1 Tax=Clytia hemisphaerica TaxID=252671 RepID=A0A7M5XD07_9CNID
MGRQSKTEINLQRLLRHCETMATESQHKETKVNWRLAKYLETADDQICKMETDKNVKVPEEVITEYKRKVTFLKDVVQAEKTQDPLERILICQHLLPTSVISSTSSINLDEEQQRNTNNKTKELHLQIKGKHQNDLRRQLLGEKGSHPHSLSKRETENNTENNIDEIIKQHHDIQEKVAEEMILMTQHMKQTTLRSRDIINKDKQELERSNKVVDHNIQKLKVESDRLEEMNKRRCSCSIWVMLGVVCIVFVNMIIFIKFFPKKRGY